VGVLLNFISQYLSPRLIREFKLFSILDDEEQSELEVTSIHNNAGYHHIRQALFNQYNLSMNEPINPATYMVAGLIISRCITSTSGAIAA